MIILFILGLVLGGLMVIFALQNTAIIMVSFFGWELTGSLAFILLLVALVGILFTLLILLPESISNYFKYKRLKKENAKLEEELRRQKELTVFAKKTPVTSEDIERIEDGVIEKPKSDI